MVPWQNPLSSDVLKEFETLFNSADQAFSEIRRLYPREFACKKGCSDCCHAMFDISLVEAVFLKRAFMGLSRKERRWIQRTAGPALKAYNSATILNRDPSTVRIRCPLLSRDDTCLLYKVRPINCRTYGVPTSFEGASHVCPRSRFKQGVSYQSLRLGPLHKRLYELSVAIGGLEAGARRWPIGEVVLDPDGLIERFL